MTSSSTHAAPTHIPEWANISQLAELIGVQRERVYHHVRKAGIQPDTRKLYPVLDVLKAVKRHREQDNAGGSSGVGEARARKLELETAILALKLQELDGSLVDRSEVEKEVGDLARRLKDRLLNIPERIAADIAAETNPRQVTRILVREIRGALEELADHAAAE